jgi:penicillin-binding protein 2
LGQKTHVDLPQEVSGVMPSEEWKIRNFKQKWYAGETISVGIGQGAVAATPIQMMHAIGGIASDGHMVRPHIVAFDNLPSEARGRYKEVAAKYPDEETVPIDPANWEIITDAMAQVVEPQGTAPSAHVAGVDFAGKTGSAQTISNAARKILKGKEYNDNSWFVGLTPRRNPDIAICVLFEGGEHGKLAARLAAQVIRAFVGKKRRVLNNVAYAAPPGGAVKPAKSTIEKPAAEKSTEPAPVQAPAASLQKNTGVEMAGVWNANSDGDQLGAGKMNVTLDAKPKKIVKAAPGMD